MKTRSAIVIALLICLATLAAAASIFDGPWAAVNPAQGAPISLNFASNGAVLTGTADGVAISNGKFQMSNLWFSLVRGGVAYNYKGTVTGTTMTLSETRADGSGTVRSLRFNHQ